jgi:TrmH family RNA methyltransferase
MTGEGTTGYRPLAVAPTLARITRLQRERQYRDRHGFYFVEGIRNFVTALDQGCAVDTLLYSERLLTHPNARKLVRQLKRSGVPFARVSPELFRTISLTERASGVGIILRQKILDLQDALPGEYPCWVVLNQVRTPGNFGTLIRTSAAIGAAGFILLGDKIDPFHPAVVRASMGALFRQTLVRASAEQLQQWVQRHSLLVVGASPDGTLAYDQVRYTRPTVLVLGEERAGLTEDQRRLCQQIVRIPMVADTDSLNLGVAGSLLMYEILRAGQGS